MSIDAARAEVAALQRADYLECAASPITFARRHATIETITGRVFRPKFWPKQIGTLKTMHEDKRVVVLKARRMGLSWLALIYALWMAIFQQGTRILILCKNEDDAAQLLERVRRMYYRMQESPTSRHLLSGMKTPVGGRKAKDAVTSLEIGASVIRALPAKARAARLETAALVILDEFGFAQESKEIWRAILPTTERDDETDLDFVDDVPSVLDGDGRLFVISTGNGVAGMGEEFYTQWNRAESGVSGFAPVFLGWRDRPDRDDAWAQNMAQQLGDDDRFKVEYPEMPDEAFLAADTDLVFDLAHLNAAVKLGGEYDVLRHAGKLRNPVGGDLYLGADFGTHTHFVLGWPLEGGGWYIAAEIVYDGADVTNAVAPVAKAIRAAGYRLAEMRYDAATPGLAAIFFTALKVDLGYSPKYLMVPFGKFKRMAIQHQNWLQANTAAGQFPRYAISPTCTRYIDQARRLEWADSNARTGVERVKKENDHGPDSGFALLAPDANKRQCRIKETDG